MSLHDVLNLILNAQDLTECEYCVGAAMTAIGAAFQTQGMFVQADLLWYLNYSGMSAFGPLIYTCAFMAGLVNVALGMPARNYLWCFLGPTFFLWLTDNPDFANGTSWQVGATGLDNNPDGDPRSRPMEDVWRLAEVGLANSSVVYRSEAGAYTYSDGTNPGTIKITATEQPDKPVEVAAPFVWWDELVSWNVQWLVAWVGPDVMVEQTAVGNNTNIAKHSKGDTFTEARWDVLRNNTWKIVEDMTDIRFSNPDARDAFVNFLGSECGQALGRNINQAMYAQAQKARGKDIPVSVIKGYQLGDFSGGSITSRQIFNDLKSTRIPVHRSLRSLLQPVDPNTKTEKGSFRYFLGKTDRLPDEGTFVVGDDATTAAANERIVPANRIVREGVTCYDYFFIIVNLARWEAGLAYHGLIRGAQQDSAGIEEDHVIYNLYYGWGIRKGNPLDPDEIDAIETTELLPIDSGDDLNLKQFTRALMTLYLFRNEMAIAPQISNVTYTPSQNISSYAESQQKSTGASSKYGEIHTWAMMVPYMQGVTLYFLAAAYPLACLAVIFPGMHKVIFTWMSFWLWVKLWDAGFAMVMAMERSIWAMLGHSKNNHKTFSWVTDMLEATGGIFYAPQNGADAIYPPELRSTKAGFNWVDSLYVFDTAMILGGSLDIDLSNAYYVYLTSALYFAVPAVTGQAVLGAKAGAAGLVTGSFQAQASDAGRGASSGYTGNMAAQITQASTTAQQSSYESGLRSGGLAGGAIAAGFRQNQSSIAERSAGMIGTGEGSVQTGIGQRAQALQGASRTQETIAREGAQAARSVASGSGSGGGGGLRGALAQAPVAAVNIGGARYAENLTKAQAGQMMDSDGRRGMASMAGSVAGGQGQLHGQAQNRLQEAANYDAQNRQADQMRNTQLATAGKMAAMGQMAGGQYGYNRPTGMPMAVGMMGGLGEQAQFQAMAPISSDLVNERGMNALTGGTGSGANPGSARQLGADQHAGQLEMAADNIASHYYGNSIQQSGPNGQVTTGDITASRDAGYRGGGAAMVDTNPDNVPNNAVGNSSRQLGTTIGSEAMNNLGEARNAITAGFNRDRDNRNDAAVTGAPDTE